MKRATTEWYNCPNCSGKGAALSAISESDESGRSSSSLSCSRCRTAFPILDGVPRFVPPANYAGSFGYQWNLHRRAQLDSHTGLMISSARLFNVTGWSKDLEGQNVLEAGSGAGRFTEILLKTGATVFSFDYSSAVDANRLNNGSADNLCLFQADILRIPLRPRAFDKVLCLGVLQHTPDPGRAFTSLARCVKPGGELVVDVYARRLTALVSWKYLLRPITKRMDPRRLHAIVENMVDLSLPLAGWLRRHAGAIGARLLPIVEYSHLGLSPDLNREWAILDTFDMYSPAHDHPQSGATIRQWFRDAGMEQITVFDGPNGVIGKGRLPPAGQRSSAQQCAASSA
ncbi:class I SAM-dependent methyltransferase [Candidatus Nitrospira nitrificans]|uniref:2-polyprenyl-3-methyl-5-hydroxy-6-metoxy-1, 4-benzoquinol methylase (Modular protein) n=1 Tax=Candidatus Nitrospira nitrificans TaxID=1742973 RepID=A0A0S4LEV2_9BACT|nr:class I SAM-dependent methyltransferase [Candidatus Nitrospira nitrificans]CUS36131.1 2-polyprenyl-3-methyl-5-hydroxy-6-metoxy-1, 4-benzoquinol methylase (modular protein) [Candidatus Nitrospira nitrificans]